MEQVRSVVRCRDPEAANSWRIILTVVLALGRGVRVYQWQDRLSVARDEAVWTAKGDRCGSASVMLGNDECDRQCSRPDMRPVAQQQG